MDLELLAVAVSAIAYWRTTLSFILFACFAVLFAQGLQWFTVIQGIVFAFLGAAIGGMLDAVAENKKTAPVSPRETSSTVANLTAAFAGTVWGISSSSTWQSISFGLPFLLVALALWRYTAISRQWLTQAQVRSCICIAAVTYLIVAAVANAMEVL